MSAAESLPGIAAAAGEELRRRGATLATAESCTGGLIAATLTSFPGASDYFWGGAVVYDERAKVALAGIDPDVLDRHGPVSAPTTEALAAGIRERSGATFGLAVTGWAGPTAGEGGAVGTVYACVSFVGGCRAGAWRFAGDRDTVRQRAAIEALALLRQRLGTPQGSADD